MCPSRKPKLVLSFLLTALLGFVLVPASGAAGTIECDPPGRTPQSPQIVSQQGKKTVVLAECGMFEADKPNVLLRLDQGGDLDPGFGTDGVVDLASGTKVIGDSNGRLLIVTAGSLKRLDLDGQVDPDFGIGGSIDLADLSAPADQEILSAQTPVQGSILIELGESRKGPRYVTRTDESGQPDPTFNGGAVLDLKGALPSVDLSWASTSPVKALEDGSILVGTRWRPPYDQASPLGAGVFKLLRSGDTDLSFGVSGYAELAAPELPANAPFSTEISSILPQDDGRTVVFGGSQGGSTLYWSTYALRGEITASGAVAKRFGALPFPNVNLGDHSITGTSQVGDKTYFSLSQPGARGEEPEYAGHLLVGRLLADGSADPGFGRDGLFGLKLGEASSAGSVAATPSGGAVIGGTSWRFTQDTGSFPAAVLVRTDVRGRRDFSFGQCGVVSLSTMDQPSPYLDPVLETRVLRRGRGLKLVSRIAPEPGSSPECSWQSAALRLPSHLTVKPGGMRHVRVFSGLGAKAERVPAKFLRLNGRVISMGRVPGRAGDDLRVAIRPAAFGKIPRAIRGKSLKLTALYRRAGVPPNSGRAEFKVPRLPGRR